MLIGCDIDDNNDKEAVLETTGVNEGNSPGVEAQVSSMKKALMQSRGYQSKIPSPEFVEDHGKSSHISQGSRAISRRAGTKHVRWKQLSQKCFTQNVARQTK